MNDPAFPHDECDYYGLSKREALAAWCMAGLLAASSLRADQRPFADLTGLAECAVDSADALARALARKLTATTPPPAA